MPSSKNSAFTSLGLFISFFSIAFIGLIFKSIHGGPLSDTWTVIREIAVFSMVGLLCWIIITKEHLTLGSIGLSPRPWKETAVWSLIILIFLVAGAFLSLALIQVAGGTFGKSEPKMKLSLMTTTLVMLRAGIAEEIFFRGYIIERVASLLKSKWIAVTVSLVPFALLHYQQGIWGIVMSFILGGILTATYLWKRNLKAI